MNTIPATFENPPQLQMTAGKDYVLWRDFEPRERGGILGFVDDLLERLVRHRLRLHWVRDIVTEIALEDDAPRTINFPFRAYRAVIARMAALIEDTEKQDPIFPYRGTGSFNDPRWPHVRFHVEFVNTKTADQHLELTPVFASEPS